jgi:hypothetical protein
MVQKKLSAKADDEAIDMAYDGSGLFCGLFSLLDVEIRLAVGPFQRKVRSAPTDGSNTRGGCASR